MHWELGLSYGRELPELMRKPGSWRGRFGVLRMKLAATLLGLITGGMVGGLLLWASLF